MNKKTLLICSLIFSTLSYSQVSTKQMAGTDKDAHGCKNSAGYTYSVIKNDCIRPFEQKIQLKQVDNKESYTTKAAVIFSNDTKGDNKNAEIFMADEKTSVLLSRKGKAGSFTWKGGKYTLTQSKKNKDYTLKKVNKVVYSSNGK